MKRFALKLVLFLLLGAILNIAVAWGCVYRLAQRDAMASLATENVLYVCSEGPLSTFSHELGVASTWRVSMAMGVTWGCPIELLNSREFEDRLPRWSALKLGASPSEASRHYTFAPRAASMSELGAGWPAISLCGATTSNSFSEPDTTAGLLRLPLQSTTNQPIEVPYLPLWPGFAINTIFYAAILWLPFAGLGAFRRRRRIKRGLCPKCAYDLRGRGSASQTCPECGANASIKDVVN